MGDENTFHHDPHRSCVACVPRFKKVAVDSTTHAITNFEFGRAFELQPHLLEHVLEFLDIASLQSIQSLNDIWKSLAERELNKRSFCSWIKCASIPSLCALKTSQDFHYCNKALGIFAYTSQTVKLDKYICLHDSPNYCRMPFTEYLSNDVVPQGVNYCAVACTDLPQMITENKHTASTMYQGIFIPPIPKIRVSTFYLATRGIRHPIREIKDNEQVRCLLIFTHKYKVRSAEMLLSNLLNDQHVSTMAMGGGLIKSIKMFPTIQRYIYADDLFCIAFTQKKGEEVDFNAYSLVISAQDASTEEDQNKMFENELVKLKETSTLRKSGMIFRFCCFAKSFKDNENSVIAKHFPKYPLFSIDVDGEIGWNSTNLSLNEDSPADEPKSKKYKYRVPQSLHGWSTVLVLITWGRKL